MQHHVQPYELAWLLLASITVLGCLVLLIESIRDVRAVRRRGIFGPLRIMAGSTVRGAIVRLVIACLLLAVAVLYTVSPTPPYAVVPAFRYVPHVIALCTALMAINVMLDNRARAHITGCICLLGPKRRRISDFDPDNEQTWAS